jgi:hypothetical protein
MSLSFTASGTNFTYPFDYPQPAAISINHTRILYAKINVNNNIVISSSNSDVVPYNIQISDGPYTASYFSYDGSVLVAVTATNVYHYTITETYGLSISGPITLFTGDECTHVSISYDGNHVLLSANNVVYFCGIYDDATFNIEIYDGKNNSLVNSISLSGNGQHIAIGLLDIGIVSFLINSGRVLTFMVPYEGDVIRTGYMERRIGNENFGKSISLDYAGTTIAIGIPGYDKINDSLTIGQQPTNDDMPIITIKNGLVRKYVYDDGWTINGTINNPVTGDTSGTFGENVYLSPSGAIIVTIVDDKYYQNHGMGSPLADVITNVKFVGEQPVYITNSQLISSNQSLPTDTYIPYKRLYPSTPDNILTRTKKITSLASTSSILAVSTTRNVHIYKTNDSDYIHAYDLLSNGKIYNDISNLSLQPEGSYLAVEHSTYISIFTILSTMQLELLSKIQNKYVKFRDIVWSSGALIIGSQDVTIVYDLTTGVYNTYNTIYNIYRIIGDDTLFTYTPGTVIKYNYINNTKDTYPIVVSGVGVIENFPDDDDTKIALGIPQEKIVTIYNLPDTTNHISLDGGLYSGFGKKIDIINGANGEIKIVISSDEYIHVYDYDTSTQSFSGYVPYYIMSSERRYITTNEGIFIIDEERKSVSFKSM